MKWDAEADAKLFACVMKVYDIRITGSKTAEVAKMLSGMVGGDCTPKALSHRLAKLRSGINTDPSTPARPKAKPRSTPGTNNTKPKTTTPRGMTTTTTPRTTTPKKGKRKLSSSPPASLSASDDEEEDKDTSDFDGGHDDSDDDLVTPTRGTERVRHTMREGARKSYLEPEFVDDEEEGERRGRFGGAGGRMVKTEPRDWGETEGPLAQNFGFAPAAQGVYGLAGFGAATTEEGDSLAGNGLGADSDGVYGLGAYGISTGAYALTGAYAPDPTVKIKPEPDTDADATGFKDEEVMAQRQGMPLPYSGFSAYDPAV